MPAAFLARAFPRDPDQPLWLRWALLAAVPLLALLHLAEALSLSGAMSSDYVLFYKAAARFAADPMTVYPPEARFTLDGYLYPPPSILLFLPLLLGSLDQAFLAANVVVLGCGLAGSLMWLRLVREDHALPRDRLAALVVLGLAMAAGPMLAVRTGQVDTIILLLCAAPVWLARRGWPKAAGALIAVGCWIKIYPVLMLFWLACRPEWRAMLAGFVLAAVAVPLLSLAVVPAELYLDYFRNQLPAMSGRAIVNIDNQSLAAVVVRGGSSIEDYTRLFTALPLPGWFRGGIVLLMLSGMGAVVLRVRCCGAPALTVASWAMALACLVAPLGWGHTYCLLLPLFIETLRLALARRTVGEIALIGGCYLALLLPAHHRLAIDTLLPGWAAQLFYARYALAALVLLAVSWRQAGRARLT